MRPFAYTRATSLREATRLAQDGAGTPMGGGTDLLGMAKAGLVAPQHIVDLTGIPEMRTWSKGRTGLRLGGALTLTELESSDDLALALPIVRAALHDTATQQLRNSGTLAGNLLQQNRCWYFRDEGVPCWHKGGAQCFAQSGDSRFHAIVGVANCMMVAPSDLAPALISFDATAELHSSHGVRRLRLADLWQVPGGPHRSEHAIFPGEILVAVTVPSPSLRRRGAFVRTAQRKSWSFAVVSVAASAIVRRGKLHDPRIVIGGVAAMPWRVREAEAVLEGRALGDGACAEASARALGDAAVKPDNAYKVPLARELVRRALQSLVA